ncbi:hypothetical protein HUK45_00745 [Limosilactobacillus sp. c9Ua_26_M]|uniref:Gram-positive cocci surface proteins LPxTG domain-containing protein n=1 Tax=Limosilactobacillus urinaemulieris TaxID=2742600 RepID=A0ABR8ZHN8_9LACO|nr:pectate lyase-like adhesive domain-containing protein [Limosilactobacillus urinaemulieris]MBD8084804.1 hypothetical protein [Limosilactobacillus urinaemulieris]
MSSLDRFFKLLAVQDKNSVKAKNADPDALDESKLSDTTEAYIKGLSAMTAVLGGSAMMTGNAFADTNVQKQANLNGKQVLGTASQTESTSASVSNQNSSTVDSLTANSTSQSRTYSESNVQSNSNSTNSTSMSNASTSESSSTSTTSDSTSSSTSSSSSTSGSTASNSNSASSSSSTFGSTSSSTDSESTSTQNNLSGSQNSTSGSTSGSTDSLNTSVASLMASSLATQTLNLATLSGNGTANAQQLKSNLTQKNAVTEQEGTKVGTAQDFVTAIKNKTTTVVDLTDDIDLGANYNNQIWKMNLDHDFTINGNGHTLNVGTNEIWTTYSNQSKKINVTVNDATLFNASQRGAIALTGSGAQNLTYNNVTAYGGTAIWTDTFGADKTFTAKGDTTVTGVARYYLNNEQHAQGKVYTTKYFRMGTHLTGKLAQRNSSLIYTSNGVNVADNSKLSVYTGHTDWGIRATGDNVSHQSSVNVGRGAILMVENVAPFVNPGGGFGSGYPDEPMENGSHSTGNILLNGNDVSFNTAEGSKVELLSPLHTSSLICMTDTVPQNATVNLAKGSYIYMTTPGTGILMQGNGTNTINANGQAVIGTDNSNNVMDDTNSVTTGLIDFNNNGQNIVNFNSGSISQLGLLYYANDGFNVVDMLSSSKNTTVNINQNATVIFIQDEPGLTLNKIFRTTVDSPLVVNTYGESISNIGGNLNDNYFSQNSGILDGNQLYVKWKLVTSDSTGYSPETTAEINKDGTVKVTKGNSEVNNVYQYSVHDHNPITYVGLLYQPGNDLQSSMSSSESTKISISQSTSQSTVDSESLSDSASVSDSLSNSVSTSLSDSASRSLSNSISDSNSASTSLSTSESASLSLSDSQSASASASVSASASQSLSTSTSDSLSNSASTSLSSSESASLSTSLSGSQSESTSLSDSASRSLSTSLSDSASVSDSLSNSVSTSLSDSASRSLSNSISVGASESLSASLSESLSNASSVSGSNGGQTSTSINNGGKNNGNQGNNGAANNGNGVINTGNTGLTGNGGLTNLGYGTGAGQVASSLDFGAAGLAGNGATGTGAGNGAAASQKGHMRLPQTGNTGNAQMLADLGFISAMFALLGIAGGKKRKDDNK